MNLKELVVNSLISEQEAKIFLMEILGLTSTEFVLNYDIPVSDEASAVFYAFEKRRLNNEPLEYIINKAFFMGLEFYVNENVLIPRPETELLVEEVLNHKGSVLDLCTGSGCILISLLKLSENRGVGVDICPKALEVARKNAAIHKVGKFLQGDLFEPVRGKFDIMVSNPPYIPTETIFTLDESVKKEPFKALDGGSDGLEFYRKLAEKSAFYLNEKGKVFLETGHDQGEAVRNIFLKKNYRAEVKKDYAGLDRIVIARL